MASRSSKASTTHTAASPQDRGAQWVPHGATVPEGASLTQRAYAEIKHRIITLGFHPGEFLNESTICQLLGLGRTPVHEALHMLKLEGMVEIIPRKGVMIRPDSLNDVIALLEARMVIEPPCMGLAAERAQARHLVALEALMEQSRRALKAGDHAQLLSLDSRFHDELADAANNPMLADVMRQLHQRATRIWHLQVWSVDDLKLTEREHEAIFNAVQRSDQEAAIGAARTHLASLKRRILHRTG